MGVNFQPQFCSHFLSYSVRGSIPFPAPLQVPSAPSPDELPTGLFQRWVLAKTETLETLSPHDLPALCQLLPALCLFLRVVPSYSLNVDDWDAMVPIQRRWKTPTRTAIFACWASCSICSVYVVLNVVCICTTPKSGGMLRVWKPFEVLWNVDVLSKLMIILYN